MELLVETRVACYCWIEMRVEWKREEKESEKLGGDGLYRVATAAGASRSLAKQAALNLSGEGAEHDCNLEGLSWRIWRCWKART